MQNVFVESSNIISALGNSTSENFQNIMLGKSGIQQHLNPQINDEPFWASLLDKQQLNIFESEILNSAQYTRYEKIIIASISDAQKLSLVDFSSKETIFIFSTTKGNISLLEENKTLPELYARLSLMHSAKIICSLFKNENEPIVISNACISGVVALLYARRILASGKYKNAIVIGADTISKFVFSGFLSFQALSKKICQPFSLNRDGINLGEAAATVVLTTKNTVEANPIQILNGAVTNDSNHISGPSRTGEELSCAINNSLLLSSLKPDDIGFISAHGTGTLFNDEMEAKAFSLSGLVDTPVNSLKGYFGHTLGAAGIVESIICFLSLQNNTIIPTLGFTEIGVTPPINICNTITKKELNYCLKSASGFGGCNATLIFSSKN